MPWWSWIVIWVVLVLLMLGMFAWFAWKLFRKLMVMLSELETLADRTDVLERAGRVAPSEQESPRRSSLFQDRAVVAARHEQQQVKRAERVDVRRQRRLLRGKLLLRADYREFLYLLKRK